MKSATKNFTQGSLSMALTLMSRYSTSCKVMLKPCPVFGVIVAFRPSTETWMFRSDSKGLRQAWPGAGSNQLLTERVSLPAPPMNVSSLPFGQ